MSSKSAITLLLLALISSTSADLTEAQAAVLSSTGFSRRPITNNVWMPTGYTLNQREFNIGIGPVGYGVTPQVQLETNLLLYVVQVPNANLKVNIMRSSHSALSVGVFWANFMANYDGGRSPFTTLAPYLAFSTKVSQRTAVHIAAQLSHFSGDIDISDTEVESYSSGTSLFGGLEHTVSAKTKFLADIGYDATFKGARLGGAVLFGWETFRLKLGVSYFSPKNSPAFTLPVIGLWWRFRG